MSPALLTKYLEAARRRRRSPGPMPHGFAFAPHPMVVEDRPGKVLRAEDRRLLRPATHQRLRLLPRGVVYKHRAPFGQLERRSPAIAARAKVSPRYLATVWQALEGADGDVGPLATLQTKWRAIPAPVKGSTRSCDQFVEIRDFVCGCARSRRKSSTTLSCGACPSRRNRSCIGRIASTPLTAAITIKRRFAQPMAAVGRGKNAGRPAGCRRGLKARIGIALRHGRAVPVAHEESGSVVPAGPARALRSGIRPVQRDLSGHVLRRRERGRF